MNMIIRLFARNWCTDIPLYKFRKYAIGSNTGNGYSIPQSDLLNEHIKLDYNGTMWSFKCNGAVYFNQSIVESGYLSIGQMYVLSKKYRISILVLEECSSPSNVIDISGYDKVKLRRVYSMKYDKCVKEISDESICSDCLAHEKMKKSIIKILYSVILTAMIAGCSNVAEKPLQDSNTVVSDHNLPTDKKTDINENEVINSDEEDLYFKSISDEECRLVWDDIKVRMSGISETFWSFDFWDEGFYKHIPAEGRYSICKYGMKDPDLQINMIALNLISTIPSAHGNDEVISYIEKYRQDWIAAHNNTESVITHNVDIVLDVLRNRENKKNWNISGTFWVKSNDRIQGAQIDGYGYDSGYPISGSDDYILSLSESKDYYYIQRVLGYFDFESGTISVLNGTSEKELISMLGYDVYKKLDITPDALSFVYWDNITIEWLNDSCFKCTYLPQLCKGKCCFSFVYDMKNSSASEVELITDDCIPSRYQD